MEDWKEAAHTVLHNKSTHVLMNEKGGVFSKHFVGGTTYIQIYCNDQL